MSSPMPATSDVSVFFAKLVDTARRGRLRWETSGSGAYSTALDGGYTLVIREVDDFDGGTPDPDHQIEVYQHGDQLFNIDRRIVLTDVLSESLSEPIEYAYPLFVEIWNRAVMSAANLDEHLAALNQILDSKLRGGR